MPTFRELMAQEAPTGVGITAASEQPSANGTPSAPVTALGEQEGANPTQQTTQQPAEQSPTEIATTTEHAKAVDESPAVPQMREHIKGLEADLAAAKPFAEVVTGYFETPEQMRPFLEVVEAAKQADPKTAAQSLGDAVYNLLGPQRYAAFVNNLSEQHGDYLRERLGASNAKPAEAPQVVDDLEDDEEELANPNPRLTQLERENQQLKAELTRFTSSAEQDVQRERFTTFRGEVVKPLETALTQIAALPGYEGVADRVKAEVFTKFDSNPQLKQQFDQLAAMAAAGEPAHLYAKQQAELRRTVEKLTADALEYHKRIVQSAVAEAEKAKATQAAANAVTQTEVPAARPAAHVAPAQPPAAPVAEAPKRSLKQTLFDKREVKAGYQEMRNAGRF